jgi:hypothetical protein
MLDFVFDIPLPIAGGILVAALLGYSMIGLRATRRWIMPWLGATEGDVEFAAMMVQGIMVFYGLAVALITVAVWDTYSKTSDIVSEEATRIACLYRDVSAYPEPIRSHLQDDLRRITEYTIDEAWPIQRRGEVPRGGVEHMNHFQATLIPFEPATESQKILHAEALRAYNGLIEARRMRLDAVQNGLSAVMWLIVGFGALIALSASFFFHVHNTRYHGLLTYILALFIAMVIFVVLALDRPFRGDLGIGPDSLRLVHDQLMKK